LAAGATAHTLSIDDLREFLQMAGDNLDHDALANMFQSIDDGSDYFDDLLALFSDD
jgi:Ca2+-binding EF-hand superfamily protein